MGESNSIKNQKSQLEEYAKAHGFKNIVHFTDDGISGTWFWRRPHQIYEAEKNLKSADKFIDLAEKYENSDMPAVIMLNEFVEKIFVHERDRKGSIETTQEVEIFFNFVGRYVPPRFGEVTPTPEEQEALRKKEETKDRLHCNYLRRKESVAQKRYEDRIKAAKKAEMDAKKNAISAEDIQKGVFVPVSALPKGELVRAALPTAINQ